MNEHRAQLLSDCREGLAILGSSESVSQRIALHFVEHTAYWNHPKAGWVQAPKHAERMALGSHGWELGFGANSFLVGLAVSRCIEEIGYFLKQVEFDDCPNYPMLQYDLNQAVRESVGNQSGIRYSGAYPEDGGFMVFGTQGIHVHTFTEIALLTARLPPHFVV